MKENVVKMWTELITFSDQFMNAEIKLPIS